LICCMENWRLVVSLPMRSFVNSCKMHSGDRHWHKSTRENEQLALVKKKPDMI
jgi:hypothetical protein